jgi:putative transcriptional regulator
MSEPAAGSLLIARPPLGDPNFEGSVVLLCAHEAAATVGLVLNRPLDLPVAAVLPEGELGAAAGRQLMWGGPVGSDQLILLHESTVSPQFGSPIHGDLHFGGGIEAARRIAEAGGKLRFFLGYSGWSEGQLEEELSEGSWFLLPPDPAQSWTTEWQWQWERLVARADPRLAWMRQAERPEAN